MPEHFSMGQVMESLRNTPIFRQLIPQEAAIGWPVPVRKKGRVYVTFFLFGRAYQPEKQQSALYPPFAALTFNWEKQRLVKFVDLLFEHPWPEGNWQDQVGTFPHTEIAQLSVSEYEARRKELFSMYDEMLQWLREGRSFPAAWRQRFGERLRVLMEPALEPFYRALEPRFFTHFLGSVRPGPVA
jgi:hypothetical protein